MLPGISLISLHFDAFVILRRRGRMRTMMSGNGLQDCGRTFAGCAGCLVISLTEVHGSGAGSGALGILGWVWVWVWCWLASPQLGWPVSWVCFRLSERVSAIEFGAECWNFFLKICYTSFRCNKNPTNLDPVVDELKAIIWQQIFNWFDIFRQSTRGKFTGHSEI